MGGSRPGHQRRQAAVDGSPEAMFADERLIGRLVC